LAKTYNPYIEGWINYYGQFYLTHFRSTLKRIDGKYKRLRPKTKGARIGSSGFAAQIERWSLPGLSENLPFAEASSCRKGIYFCPEGRAASGRRFVSPDRDS